MALALVLKCRSRYPSLNVTVSVLPFLRTLCPDWLSYLRARPRWRKGLLPTNVPFFYPIHFT